MSELQTYYLFEPVIAWRAWLIQAHEEKPPWRSKLWWQYLLSIYNPGKHWLEWSEKPMESICVPPTFLERIRMIKLKWAKHGAPDPVCQCGFYGAKTAEDLLCGFDLSVLRTRLGWRPLAVGRVALWGRLIEHEQGYRAQFAWPVEIWVFGFTHLPLLYCYDRLYRDEIPYDLIQMFLNDHCGIQVHIGEIFPEGLKDQVYWESSDGELPPVAARIGKIVGDGISKP
ncbi:MAG: hypothetical protein AAB642_03520 [Patescibacteria group bacterium]